MVLCDAFLHRLLLLVCFFAYATITSASDINDSNDQHTKINQLRQLAYSNPEGSPQFLSAWQQILNIDQRNLEAHVLLGSNLMAKKPQQEFGFQLLEASFDSAKVTPTIDFRFPQTYLIAALIGRYRSQRQEYVVAKKFTELALELSKVHGKMNSNDDGDICIQMQLASMFDYFPNSIDAADEAIDSMTHYAERLLTQPNNWSINDAIVSTIPGGAEDPYVHCMLSAFFLSFYYRADVAAVASRFYQMARRGWPTLDTTADFVKKYDISVKESGGELPCITRKIRMAVISAVITEGHSNSETFGGIFSRLDRNIFDITYVLITEQNNKDIAKFTKVHPSDKIFIWGKEEGDVGNGAWTTRWGKEIESWEMDIIFYFELSMSSFVRRLGMQRLAPVQVNSCGHPITSGHDRSVVQYYVSWADAELPLEQSQTHYTEELILIEDFYLYFERRILPGQISRMNGMPFGTLTRSDFNLPKDKRMYLCMQKPHKFHPEFDELVCGIITRDLDGWVILHRAESPANQKVFEDRLERAGCDLSRITFFDFQPHHRLLALYRESTVILDSYPAGGDTTTKEVIEMGKPLVTLPARLFGGRWSLGYLSNIGLKESTQKALIASTPEEYINLAVKLGTDDKLRESVEADMRKCSPNLFNRDESVTAWQNMFLKISPYQQCQEAEDKESQNNSNNGKEEL